MLPEVLRLELVALLRLALDDPPDDLLPLLDPTPDGMCSPWK